MASADKSKEELLREIEDLKGRLAELERHRDGLKQAKEYRRETEVVRTALRGSPLVVFTHDRQLRYDQIYNSHPDLPPEKMVGKTDADLFPPEEAQRLMEIKRRVLQTGVEQHEETKVTIKGREYYYYKCTVPVRDEAGAITGLACACLNITDRKLAEEALRESEARYRTLSENLEETVRQKVEEMRHVQYLAALGEMISVVAHDLRNPLQNVQLAVEMMRKEVADDPDKLELLEEMEYGVNILNRIISDLLEYSRPTALNRSPQTIGALVERALDITSHALSNISVKKELRDGQREILLDPQKIIRVLINLITNSAEAMPSGGTLSIESDFIECDGAQMLELKITDTGKGIPSGDLSRVWQPFFTTKPNGTGLGIPISKKNVEAHDGTLTIQSEENKGTTVTITLPFE